MRNCRTQNTGVSGIMCTLCKKPTKLFFFKETIKTLYRPLTKSLVYHIKVKKVLKVIKCHQERDRPVKLFKNINTMAKITLCHGS